MAQHHKKYKQKSDFSIKYKMILGIGIPLILVLAVIGTVLRGQIVSTVETLKKAEIQSQTKTASEQINSFFQPFFVGAAQVADIDCVYNIISQSNFDPSASLKNSEHYTVVLNELREAMENQNSALLSICVAGTKAQQLLVSDGSVMEDFDVESRGWYQQLQQAGGGEILSAAYVDAVTGKLVVSAASGIYRGNELIGAVAFDISLDGLIQEMANIAIGKEGFVTVYDRDGYILYHPVSDLIMTHMDAVGYNSEMYNALISTSSFEPLPYERDGGRYYGAVEYMDNINWNVMGCMSRDEFMQEATTMTALVVSSFTFCAVLLMIITIVMSLTIVRPIQVLDSIATQLAEGNLDVTVNVKSKDEVGHLAASISALVERLRTYIVYINEIAALLHEMGNGNLCLTFRNSFDGDFRKIKDEMENTVSLLSNSLESIRTAAAQVDAGSDQLASGAQGLSQGATEQAAATEALSDSINKVNLDIQACFDKANDAKNFTTNAGNQVAAANTQMDQMLLAMNEINERSQEISKIIKTIEDIAFQTNILALNAAVEAARAGAAGKGFAVVADEVRNLAAKSAEASQNTSALIEASISAVAKGVKLAQDTADQMKVVAESASQTMTCVVEVSELSERQARAMEQINQNVNQIGSVVAANSATAEESAAASEELSSQAAMLKELVGGFQLNSEYSFY